MGKGFGLVVRRRDGSIEVKLGEAEREVLGDVLGQLRDALVADTDDPMLARLFPPAYPDDEEKEAGFRVLARGELLGVYPEGTRSPDGRLYRGKTGVARMALEGHVPVLPVVMMGTDRVQPIGKRIPSIRQVGVIIGAPLDFSRYEGMESDRFVLRSITDEIMYELMELSGQEYVDVYATAAKERAKRADSDEAAEPAPSAAPAA